LPGLIRHTHLQRQRRSSLGLPCNLRKRIRGSPSPWQVAAPSAQKARPSISMRCPAGCQLDPHRPGNAKHLLDARIVRRHLLHLATCLTGRSRGSAPLHETLCVAPVSYRQRHSALFTTWDDSMTRKWSIPVDGCHRRQSFLLCGLFREVVQKDGERSDDCSLKDCGRRPQIQSSQNRHLICGGIHCTGTNRRAAKASRKFSLKKRMTELPLRVSRNMPEASTSI